MRSLLRRRLLLPLFALAAVVGPAFITANVDNDAPGIATYSVAGAHYGYDVLWILWPTLLVLLVVQEISSRMGVATGKGLADLIREEFGVKVTLVLMALLIVTNLANTAGEFAGLAEGARIFGVPRLVSVPLGAFFVWMLVLRGSYQNVERIFLVACLVYLAYPISGFLAHPDWAEVARRSVTVTLHTDLAFASTVVGIVGTTIAPWMQFYLQATVVEKGTRPSQWRLARWDVIVGSLFAIIVVFFIVIACAATLHPTGQRITSAGQAAAALAPLAGKYASTLFAIGLLNAALFASSILPLSTAYTVCEGIGWERGLDRKFRQAPHFYTLYSALIIAGAGIVLLAGERLLTIMLVSQVMNGVLLPVILIMMVRLVTRRRIMEALTASRGYAILCWVLVVLLIGLDLFLLGATVLG
jgi:NRAMP (natural resistance-associated macrophage protein)-like metal ion transporter